MLRFLRHQDKHRTDQAVIETRQTWFGRIAAAFQRSQLDQELWDELEELLVSADVGFATAERLILQLRKRVQREHVGEPREALELLKQEMVDALTVQDNTGRHDADGSPLVILVVGVNGVGKTTSIAKLAHLYQTEGGVLRNPCVGQLPWEA